MEPDQLTYRSRTGWVVLAGVLTEVAIVGGVDNQGVTGALNHYVESPNRNFPDYSTGLIDAMTAFAWRVSPANNQPTHVWAAGLAAIGALLLLSGLGMLAVVRGSITFARVWIAVWAVVAAVAPLAVMVRNLITTPSAPGPEQSRLGQAVYFAPQLGTVVVAGLVIGLLAGLACAIVAVSTRHEELLRAKPEALPETEAELSITQYQTPPPWPPEPAPWQPEQQPWQPPPEQQPWQPPPEQPSQPPPEQADAPTARHVVTEAHTWPDAPIQRQSDGPGD